MLGTVPIALLQQSKRLVFIKVVRNHSILELVDFLNQFFVSGEVKDISTFKKLDKALVYEMDKVLTHDIPELLRKVRDYS